MDGVSALAAIALMHRCPHCHKVVARKSWTRHIGGHINRFRCTNCPLEFTHRSNMKRHMREMHSFTARYRCERCNRLFKRSSHLTQHLTARKRSRCQG